MDKVFDIKDLLAENIVLRNELQNLLLKLDDKSKLQNLDEGLSLFQKEENQNKVRNRTSNNHCMITTTEYYEDTAFHDDNEYCHEKSASGGCDLTSRVLSGEENVLYTEVLDAMDNDASSLKDKIQHQGQLLFDLSSSYNEYRRRILSQQKEILRLQKLVDQLVKVEHISTAVQMNERRNLVGEIGIGCWICFQSAEPFNH